MKFCIPFTLPGLEITQVEEIEEKLVIHAQGMSQQSQCPICNNLSSRRHSAYTRIVKDLPIGLKLVEIHLATRRFRCVLPTCPQRTFAEQYPDIVPRYRRRTNRFADHVTQIGIALGGQAGARLAEKLQMPTSGSTILRLLRQITLPAVIAPRIIGIDDWAFRKGTSYGTIIVDLERHQPIDLLPSRESPVVQEWLVKHPTIELVTRDRSGEYKDAVTRGAPQATQVADRWHLTHNLFETVVRHLSRRYQTIC